MIENKDREGGEAAVREGMRNADDDVADGRCTTIGATNDKVLSPLIVG